MGRGFGVDEHDSPLHNAYTQNLEILVTIQAAGILNFPAFFPKWDQGSKTSVVPHNY